MQFEIDAQMSRGLRLVSVWPQWNRKIRFEVFDRDRFVILDLQPLRAPRRNWRDAGAEDRIALGFLGTALTHLQQAWVNRLLLELVVDFFRALAFKDHCRQSHGPVPGGEIGNRGVAGQRENVIPFFNGAGMVGKHLANEDARVAIVDAHGNFHFFEREDGGIRLLLVAGDEDSRVAKSGAAVQKNGHRKRRADKTSFFMSAASALVCGPGRYPYRCKCSRWPRQARSRSKTASRRG